MFNHNKRLKLVLILCRLGIQTTLAAFATLEASAHKMHRVFFFPPRLDKTNYCRLEDSVTAEASGGSGAGGLMGRKGGCCSYQSRNLIDQIEPRASGHTAKPRGLSVTGCGLSFLGLFIFLPLSDRRR